MSVFAEIFKEKGISLTNSRLAIFDILENSTTHMTINEIFEEARKKDENLGLATVYRTLNTLCELGLVEKHEFPNLSAVYEKTVEHSKHHHHIVDLDSGTIEEFSTEKVDKLLEEIAAKHGYKMLGHKIEIYGEKL